MVEEITFNGPLFRIILEVPHLYSNLTPVWIVAIPPQRSIHAPPLPSRIVPVANPASEIILANSG